MCLNERIKQYRNELHLTQDYVAKYLEINRSTYTQIELGKRKLTADELAKLCKLFGVSSDRLLYGNTESHSSLIFIKQFEELDDQDQQEILNLIQFKIMRKNNKNKKGSIQIG